jgi:hypothetical protein
MGTPEHQDVIAAAVLEAVDGFCRERRPAKPDRIARPDGPAKARLRPAAVTGPTGAVTRP